MATYDVGGRSAIVTGAGSGIGRAVARLLAVNGAAVLVTDINEMGLKAVVDEIHAAGGTAASLVGDVADQEFAERTVAAASELGPLRIAVNNAGIGGASAPVGEYPLDSWRQVIDINQNGVFYGMRAQLPAIAATDGGGAIVNIASILGSVGFANAAAYVTAKHAIVGLTKNAALEYAAQGVRVNAVGPGFIVTPLMDANLDEEVQAFIASKHAVGRLGTADEVAAPVAFLASDAASFITGGYYVVDGGYTAQ
jgi:NAD(P)-dependent dehydrogenase (short-subunit alcohol dehydrogenase family)